MTENTKIAMQAINKWFYYAMNYNDEQKLNFNEED